MAKPDKKFTLFHLSLTPRREPTFDTFQGNREQWLRHALSERMTFNHWGQEELHWVPLEHESGLIFGLLQRTRRHAFHRSPDEGGEEVEAEEWQGAYILIDPKHHEDGQKAAVENDVVGSPRALLKSLVAHINSREDHPYLIAIEPLFDSGEFWSFSKEHGNMMRSIYFDFVVPNMWKTEKALEQDLEETGKKTGAQRIKFGLESPDGVSTQNDQVQTGVDYVEKGAGTLSAKSMNGERFVSTKKPKTTTIPQFSGYKSEVISYLANLRNRIFGREQDAVDDPDNSSDGSSVD